MLMISPQIEQPANPSTIGANSDLATVLQQTTTVAGPVKQIPLFADFEQFMNWWMTRRSIVSYPADFQNGRINLLPQAEACAEAELSPELREVIELIGEREIGDEIDGTTDHAWLVVLGHFAQALDLVAKLEEVSLSQRQGQNGKAQSKIIEFLVGILGGIDYLRDLNEASNPIATDPKEELGHKKSFLIILKSAGLWIKQTKTLIAMY